jgi:hypothetical protein
MLAFYKKSLFPLFITVFFLALGFQAQAQSGGSSTSVTGTVVDPTGAVVANATVELRNPVSHFERTTSTDNAGKFTIPNIPFNPYHLTVGGAGFAPYAQDVDVRSIVPINVSITLQIKGSSESVTVEASGEDLLENDPTFHTDVSKELFDKMPLESQSSSLSSLVTLSSPGIAADSNAYSRDSDTTRKTRFPWMASPSRTSRARSFPTKLPLIRLSPWKSSRERRPPSMATRPAW